MDGSMPEATPANNETVGSGYAAAAPDPAALEQEFTRLVAAVNEASREWGVRPDSREGRFVSALLGTTGWFGRLSLAAQASARAEGRHNREAAELELARAKEITRAAQIALNQARNAQISLQIEQVNVTDKMIKETLPMFIEKLQGALVLRERRWNDRIQRRRYAVVSLVTLGLFLGGYVLGAWGDPAATNALVQCLAHPLQAQGHLYCDVTSFAQANQ